MAVFCVSLLYFLYDIPKLVLYVLGQSCLEKSGKSNGLPYQLLNHALDWTLQNKPPPWAPYQKAVARTFSHCKTASWMYGRQTVPATKDPTGHVRALSRPPCRYLLSLGSLVDTPKLVISMYTEVHHIVTTLVHCTYPAERSYPAIATCIVGLARPT